MEQRARGFAAVAQLLSEEEPARGRSKPAAWHRPPVCCGHQRRPEVVCPQPVRPACSRGTASLFQRQAEMELLGFLLGQDGELDSCGGGDDDDGGFFFGTPPARTGNPIIYDAEFLKQRSAAAVASSPASYASSAKPSPRFERGANGSYGPPPPPSSSPFTSVPSIRVEGFPSAGSDPHPRRRIVVSALA